MLNILVSVRKPFATPARYNQLVNGVARRRRHLNEDAGMMQDDSWLRLVNEEIKKAQRLGVGSQCGQRLGLSGFPTFVGGEKVDPQAASCGIASHPPAIDGVRDRAKGLVGILQYLKHRRGTMRASLAIRKD